MIIQHKRWSLFSSNSINSIWFNDQTQTITTNDVKRFLFNTFCEKHRPTVEDLFTKDFSFGTLCLKVIIMMQMNSVGDRFHPSLNVAGNGDAPWDIGQNAKWTPHQLAMWHDSLYTMKWRVPPGRRMPW